MLEYFREKPHFSLWYAAIVILLCVALLTLSREDAIMKLIQRRIALLSGLILILAAVGGVPAAGLRFCLESLQ